MYPAFFHPQTREWSFRAFGGQGYFLTFRSRNPSGELLTMTSVPCVTSFVRTASLSSGQQHSVCQDFALGEKLNPNLLLPIVFVGFTRFLKPTLFPLHKF